MSTWILVWLLITLVTTMAVIALLVALGRQVLIVGRTAARFQDEVGPVAGEISRDGTRLGDRAQNLKIPRSGPS